MQTFIEVSIALLPFAILIGGFLIFKMDALIVSAYALGAEAVIVLVYYHLSPLRILEASLWGNVTMWTGFLVLYTGQIFGQAYRATGLLQVLLESVQSIVPADDKEGRAVALVTVVGGFIGAFNGFATYPVTIPGLVALGYDGIHAVTAYLVYFSWSVPFASMFIGANIANAATHVPVPQIAQYVGLLCVPLIFISLIGFFRILGFRFFHRETQELFWLLGLGNSLAVILFTLVWPHYYLLTLVAAAVFSLVILSGYGFLAKRRADLVFATASSLSAAATPPMRTAAQPWSKLLKAYAPLAIGVVVVAVTMVPSLAPTLDKLKFTVAWWGYRGVGINIFTSAGFFILVTALSCYLFRCKPTSMWKDLAAGSKRSASSVATLFLGSAMVYLMVDTGQITLLGKVLSSQGTAIYAALNPFLTFLGGMAFGQGLPGAFLFAQMQMPVAPALGIPLILLIGLVTVVTMGPPNPLKPALIRYAASLAELKGCDGQIFRINLPWQLLQVATIAVFSFILILTGWAL
jgi:L-lactate permease